MACHARNTASVAGGGVDGVHHVDRPLVGGGGWGGDGADHTGPGVYGGEGGGPGEGAVLPEPEPGHRQRSNALDRRVCPGWPRPRPRTASTPTGRTPGSGGAGCWRGPSVPCPSRRRIPAASIGTHTSAPDTSHRVGQALISPWNRNSRSVTAASGPTVHVRPAVSTQLVVPSGWVRASNAATTVPSMPLRTSARWTRPRIGRLPKTGRRGHLQRCGTRVDAGGRGGTQRVPELLPRPVQRRRPVEPGGEPAGPVVHVDGHPQRCSLRERRKQVPGERLFAPVVDHSTESDPDSRRSR